MEGSQPSTMPHVRQNENGNAHGHRLPPLPTISPLCHTHHAEPLGRLPRRRPPGEAADVVFPRLQLFVAARAELQLLAVPPLLARPAHVGGGAVVHFEAPVGRGNGVGRCGKKAERGRRREAPNLGVGTRALAAPSYPIHHTLTTTPQTSAGTRDRDSRTGWTRRARGEAAAAQTPRPSTCLALGAHAGHSAFPTRNRGALGLGWPQGRGVEGGETGFRARGGR